ncbi:protein tas-like isoform X2 [Helianthus annuus]|uniref:protein tas-like isoform X2 n=1 Tax=Helianthus annuus TaxID=4232 RepID=UPI001652EC99|nr:protein tas-like isoform X2 [Helianthus annuus]
MYLNSSQPWLTTTCTLYTGESCSLLRAQTDSIDLYQVHWPDRYVPMFGETDYDPASQYYFIQFLGRVVDAGKIRFIGVSNETPYGVMKFLQAAEKNPAYPRIISVQYCRIHTTCSVEILIRGWQNAVTWREAGIHFHCRTL